jgi:thymidylate kinase
MIIAIEGLDGSGKTTLGKLLAARLGGHYLKFPNRQTTSGKLIDHHLRSSAYVLPESFQALQVVNRIEQLPTLLACHNHATHHVVCDRYTASGLVYGRQDGLARADIETWNQCLPPANLSVLLAVDPVCIDGERLKGRDREVYENRGLQGLEDQARRFEALWAERKADPTWRVFIGPDRSPQDLVTALCHVISELGYFVPQFIDRMEVTRG